MIKTWRDENIQAERNIAALHREIQEALEAKEV